MTRLLIFVVAALFISAASAQAPQAIVGSTHSPVSSGRVASVYANTASTAATIPANFIGLSTEVSDLINGCYQGTNGNWSGCGSGASSAASFISLAKLVFGTNCNFRLGGSSSDTATPPALTQQIATNLQAFLAAISSACAANVIYGLDLFSNNSATAASQAGFLATAFGAGNLTFQFSNEPLASGHFGSIGAYQTAWNAYYTAVTAAVPGAKYASWDDSDIQDAPSILPGLTPGVSGLSLVTYHRYGQGATPSAVISYVPTYTTFMATNNNYLPNPSIQRLTETNTLGSGGTSGLSDRMMAATFILDESIQLANLGYAGLNVHNRYAGAPVYYSPFSQLGDNNFGAAPIFYGMYLFVQIEGQQIIASSVGGSGNVNCIATLRTANKANILCVNNDTANAVAVTPQQSAAWSTANVLQVKSATGAGCTDASVTVGGQAIGESGSWSGAPFSISSSQSFTLGPCEAALISVQ